MRPGESIAVLTIRTSASPSDCNVLQPLSDKWRCNMAMNRFLLSVLARNASFLAVTFIQSWKVTVALPFPAERLWWVLLLVDGSLP